MRTDQLAKIALTVAVISLAVNYVQFLDSRAQTRAHQIEISRLHIEHRKETMLDRAAAFHELVLGNKGTMQFTANSGLAEGEYRIEYAVRIPDLKRQEFEAWMASAKPPQFSISARGYSHESAGRRVQTETGEAEEMFEKFVIAAR
jgi:hypothetical protein